MLAILSGALLTASVAPAPQRASQTWSMTGSTPYAYDLQASGHPADPAGAAVTLRSALRIPTGYGAATFAIPAAPYHGGYVRLRGELTTAGAADGASFWIRADGDRVTLWLDDGSHQRIHGTTGWTAQELVIPVPDDARTLWVGVLLTGLGETRARGLRVEAIRPEAPDAPVGPAVREYLDSAFTFVREHWLWRDTVAWDDAAAAMWRQADSATTIREAHEVIRALLLFLGDAHSSFVPPAPRRTGPTRRQQWPRADVQLRSDRIAQVTVPAYSYSVNNPNFLRGFMRYLRQRIESAADSGACGFVVDLRGSGGDNMWPILAGLQPLLGGGWVGGFSREQGSPETRWTVAGPAAEPDSTSEPGRGEHLPVAVLTGPGTENAGEAIDVAFRGRPDTRFFGLPTAGRTTGIRALGLPDGGLLALTDSWLVDREGKVYRAAIPPDEVVAGGRSKRDDPALQAAVAWLGTQRACGRP